MNTIYKILDEIPSLSDADLEIIEKTVHEVRSVRYATERMQNAVTDRKQESPHESY